MSKMNMTMSDVARACAAAGVVSTLYEEAELATVIEPRHRELPLLPGWYVVRYDYDGRRGTVLRWRVTIDEWELLVACGDGTTQTIRCDGAALEGRLAALVGDRP